MNAQSIHERLIAPLPPRGFWPLTSQAIDPWIEIRVDGLPEMGRYLRDEPDLAFDMLLCITAVDYFEPDAKKAAQVDWQPHLELIYHLASTTQRHRLVLKVRLPRWMDDQPGAIARGAERGRRLADGRLARAGGLRPDGRVFPRPSRPSPHPVPRRLGGPPVA